jgi:hypothetical protein
MDDTNRTVLTEAQYEWALRLVHVLQPLVYEAFHTIFQESLLLCRTNEEEEKYLMTFQNFLARVPKWSDEMVQQEANRIVDKSGCTYLEDLITCVHITHLKILTSIRTGKTQKKIDVAIPKLNKFVHKVYINTSRALYSSVFLFDKDVAPLMVQKNKSEFNKLIKSSILDAIRESIPVEQLLRSYLDETTDLMKEEEKPVVEPPKPEPPPKPPVVEEVKLTEVGEVKLNEVKPTEIKMDALPPETCFVDPVEDLLKSRPTLKFANVDRAITVENVEEFIPAPKSIERLTEIAEQRHAARKAEEAEDSDDTLKIMGEDLPSLDLGIEVIS